LGISLILSDYLVDLRGSRIHSRIKPTFLERSLSLAAQRQKYVQLCHDARQTTTERLSPLNGVSFTLTEWSGRAYEASKLWDGGYYDWLEISRRFSEPDRLALALWAEDRLLAMALATTTGSALFLQVVEGDPAADCPLQGLRLEIILDACANYAQCRGKSELRLEPKNQDLVALYENVYGFHRVNVRGGAPYWCRKV